MSLERWAAALTWFTAAGFGISAPPVGVFLVRNDRLPSFLGLFEMYGGPWSSRFGHGTFVLLLAAFTVLSAVTALVAWGVWAGSGLGLWVSLALIPVEAVFWIGFALPLPWLIGIARVALLLLAVRQ